MHIYVCVQTLADYTAYAVFHTVPHKHTHVNYKRMKRGDAKEPWKQNKKFKVNVLGKNEIEFFLVECFFSLAFCLVLYIAVCDSNVIQQCVFF